MMDRVPARPDPELVALVEVVRERRARPAAGAGAFVIAIDGSVSVGKSTTAAFLAELLHAPPEALGVQVVSTDGFLFPNRILAERGLVMRKGFPESYDLAALVAFVDSVRTGAPELQVPVYSHEVYDVLDERVVFATPEVLVLEGLHTLRLAPAVDLSVYVDAAEADIERWYTERFLELTESGSGFYAQFRSMSRAAQAEFAREVWETINGPNLHEYILPTKPLADAVVEKGPDHAVRRVTLRE
jgi:type I pantothenate kinase